MGWSSALSILLLSHSGMFLRHALTDAVLIGLDEYNL